MAQVSISHRYTSLPSSLQLHSLPDETMLRAAARRLRSARHGTSLTVTEREDLAHLAEQRIADLPIERARQLRPITDLPYRAAVFELDSWLLNPDTDPTLADGAPPLILSDGCCMLDAVDISPRRLQALLRRGSKSKLHGDAAPSQADLRQHWRRCAADCTAPLRLLGWVPYHCGWHDTRRDVIRVDTTDIAVMLDPQQQVRYASAGYVRAIYSLHRPTHILGELVQRPLTAKIQPGQIYLRNMLFRRGDEEVAILAARNDTLETIPLSREHLLATAAETDWR